MQTGKVAHFRLTFSRQMFVVACPRETQEMVFDAHNRAFAFFGGVPLRMVYDNLKAVVETILTGKDWLFNRRFLVLANHYVFEPVACSPASGGPLPGRVRDGDVDLPGAATAGGLHGRTCHSNIPP